MKRSRRVYVSGVMLAMIVSCSRGTGEQPTTDIPPAPPVSAVTTNGYEVTAVSDGGSVGGTIAISGPISKLPVRKIGKDPQVCGKADRETQKLVVNGTGRVHKEGGIVGGVEQVRR